MTSFAASPVVVCATLPESTSFLQTSGPTVLWEYGTSCVMCLCCWAVLLWGEGGREEWEVISDMPQLVGSNPEKTLPTWKKSSRSEAVFRLILLFPLGHCQYIQFWLVPINQHRPEEKLPAEDCVPSFPWPSRVLDWYFFFSQHVQIAVENWLTLHWQKTSESDSLQGRKLKIKDWLCKNTCSFLPFKKNRCCYIIQKDLD